MTDWFRSWHGAPTDNKWLVIARRAGVAPGLVSAVVWALLDHASQAQERGSVSGFDVETYAAFSGFDDAHVIAVIEALTDKGVIADGFLASWDRRQPKREDGAAERAKAWREQKKTPSNVVRTQANASERPREEQRREDTEEPLADAKGAEAPIEELTPLASVWQDFPHKLAALSQKSEASVRTWMGKALKGHTPEAFRAAAEAAVKAGTGDPFGYITRALTAEPPKARSSPYAKPNDYDPGLNDRVLSILAQREAERARH